MAEYPQREGADDGAVEESDMPVLEKVAVLFVALGQEVAGEVMKFLSDF